MLGERIQLRTWLIMAIVAAGITIMFIDSLSAGGMVGNIMALGCALSFSGNVIVLRQTKNVNMLPAIFLAGMITVLVTLPFALPIEGDIIDLPILALLGSALGLGLLLFIFGTRYLLAAESSMLTLQETILGPLWVWLCIGEQPTIYALIGGVIVITALAVHFLMGMSQSKVVSNNRERRF
jgi:drug/metabolite transporter (DMT)-like permease